MVARWERQMVDGKVLHLADYWDEPSVVLSVAVTAANWDACLVAPSVARSEIPMAAQKAG
jgi:hypothetical protein